MKIKIMLLTIPLLLTLNGCSSKTEVRNKGFIRTIGADYDEKQTVAIQLYDGDETVAGQGETLFSAIADSEHTQSKNFFAGHLELFVSSPENIYENLTSLLSNNRISPSCSVMCVSKNASKLVEESENDFLPDLIESNSRSGFIIRKNISSVIDDLMGNDGKSAVPVFKDDELYMAVIDEKQIIGTLSRDESRGLCWLNGNINDVYLPLDINGEKTNFYVRKSSAKIKAEKQGDKINITAEIKLNGNAEKKNLDREEVRNKTAELISALCAKAIAKTVTGMHADVFGIEKSISSSGISDKRSWDELVPNLSFYYNIKISE